MIASSPTMGTRKPKSLELTMAAPQNAQITVKVNGVDEEILVKELTDWQTEAHKSKEDFDNFPDKFELLKVFEII